ncbi:MULTISPECIES: hypothetical protein [unclassified Streptomyces]|uniref:hypothetical protein n=1 Tax=unclassified Streptomyces TaxID=2593676 RepID=UPI000939CB68|nr:hypothetical protein [Streptomyces sp. TSRI0107]OKJ84151.1 hypothetical protein AMK31_18765 [Streptomyces sp. TSRI0107]
MTDLIHRTTLWLRLLLTPGTGKRRRTPHRPHLTAVPRALPEPLPQPRSPYGLDTPLDGTASRLVRPYLRAADHGIDLDQRLIGTREVAA